jgi:hypothetical protein
MSVIDQLLDNAKGYADEFDKGDLPQRARLRLPRRSGTLSGVS